MTPAPVGGARPKAANVRATFWDGSGASLRRSDYRRVGLQWSCSPRARVHSDGARSLFLPTRQSSTNGSVLDPSQEKADGPPPRSWLPSTSR